MPLPTQQPPQIPPTGIGLLDLLLRTIRQDPWGGFGTFLGTPQAMNPIAQGIRPGIFQSLARRPEDIHVFGGQQMPLGQFGETGLFDLIRDALTPQQLATRFGPDVARASRMASPNALFIRLAPEASAESAIPAHEVGHGLQYLRGALTGLPSPSVQARLGTLPTVTRFEHPGEQSIQALAELFYRP